MRKVIFLIVLSLSWLYGEFEQRNYTKIVKNDKGDEILKLEIKYIGKEPVFPYLSKHRWQGIDTDFYNLTYANLSDKPIEFIKRKGRSKFKVPYFESGRYLPNDKENIVRGKDSDTRDLHKEPEPFGTTLAPKQSFLLKNVFYHYNTYNVRYLKTTIKHDGKLLDYKLYYIYSPGTDSFIALQRYYGDFNGYQSNIPYMSNHNINKRSKHFKRLIIPIHDASYDVNSTFHTLYTQAKKLNQDKNTLILAPQFLTTQQLKDNPYKNDILHWKEAPFNGNFNATIMRAKVKITAFDVLDTILTGMLKYHKSIKEVVIVGNKEGGEFVHHYAKVAKVAKEGVKIRYIAINTAIEEKKKGVSYFKEADKANVEIWNQ